VRYAPRVTLGTRPLDERRRDREGRGVAGSGECDQGEGRFRQWRGSAGQAGSERVLCLDVVRAGWSSLCMNSSTEKKLSRQVDSDCDCGVAVRVRRLNAIAEVLHTNSLYTLQPE